MERFRTLFTDLRSSRSRILLLALPVLAAVFLLAIGLSGLELQPGDPDAFNWLFQFMDFRGSAGVVDPGVLDVFRIIYLIGLVLLPFYLIYVIVNPKARRRFIRDMIMVGSFMLMFLLLADYLQERAKEAEPAEVEGFGAMGEFPLGEGGTPALPASPSETAIWIAALLVALVVVVIVTLVLWIVWRSRRRQDAAVARIATEVQAALDDLQSGANLRNVVIRCYSEMVKVLNEQRGIQRNVSLTPREFEDSLQNLGFPLEAVHQLTHLFEGVRYGHKPISKREEIMAVDSLTTILEVCRGNP